MTNINWMHGRQNNVFSHNIEDYGILAPSKNGQWDDIICGFYKVSNGTHTRNRVKVNSHICDYSKSQLFSKSIRFISFYLFFYEPRFEKLILREFSDVTSSDVIKF